MILTAKIVALLIFFGCARTSISQIKITDIDEMFAPIPTEIRAKLAERLNLFIQLERNGDWDKAYALISDTFKADVKGGYALNDYKNDKNVKIKEFDPRHVSPVNNEAVFAAKPIAEIKGHYFIEGCGKWRGGGGEGLAIIEAYWEKGDWYFSFMQALGMHETAKCIPRKKSKK